LGELGWSLNKYLESTLYELNYASSGYWIRWERNTAWLAREIMYMSLALSPDIKPHKKPKKEELMRLNIDFREVVKDEADILNKVTEFENRLKHNYNGKTHP